MPELPEVETVVRELNKNLKDKVFIDVDPIFRPIFNGDFHNVENLKVQSVNRRAKYIVFNFYDTDIHLISHLRMTGKYIFNHVDEKEEKFIRCIFTLNDNSKMYYLDMRKFGRFDLTINLDDYFKHIGIEPLDKNFTYSYLKQYLKGETPMKSFLLNQSVIAGLGNIYADEVLFLSRIHPKRKANSLSETEIKNLVSNIKTVITKAIDNMGTKLSDYRDTDKGKNQNYLNVYGRENKFCNICGTVISKIKMVGRGTHFCSECQKL